jgi:hypothetical protein
MMQKIGLITLLVFTIALAATAMPALGTLSPISFGFPTMSTTASTTAFNMADINAFDFENANVGLLGSGVTTGFGIPMASQSDIIGQTAHTVDFAQTSQFSSFAYPAVDTGLGFAGFWGF